MGNQKGTGKAKSMPVGLALGATWSCIVTIVMVALGAKLVDSGVLKENTIGYIAMITLLAASYVGAMVGKNSVKRRLLMVCALSGVIYFTLLLMTTALFFGGQFAGVGVTALVILCGSALALLVGNGKGGEGPRKRTKRIAPR